MEQSAFLSSSLGDDDEDRKDYLSESNAKNLAAELLSEEDRIIARMGRPHGEVRFESRKRRRRRQYEAKVLQANRLKFMENWSVAIGSGSAKVIEELFNQWIKPDVVYREQFIHFVGQTLLYREIHSTRLLFQYMMTLLRAFPDVVQLDFQQTLKTKRDGSAYAIATYRIVGSYTFRLLTTNASCQAPQFLTQTNPLRSVITSDHLLNRTHLKAFLRGQKKFTSSYVSSFPAVYHTYPVEYDVLNGVLIPKGEMKSEPLRLPPFIPFPKPPDEPSSTDMGITPLKLPKFDDEDIFEDIFTALLDDGEEEEEDEGDQSDDDYLYTGSQTLSLQSRNDLPPASKRFMQKIDHAYQSPSPVRIFPNPNSAPQSLFSPISKHGENSREVLSAQRDVLDKEQLAFNTLRSALTLLPHSTSEDSSHSSSSDRSSTASIKSKKVLKKKSKPSSLNLSTSAFAESATDVKSITEEEYEDEDGDLNTGLQSLPPDNLSFLPFGSHLNGPFPSSSSASTNQQASSVSPQPPLSILDFIKVSTPYTQFFAMERLPRQYPVHLSQTYVVHFEPSCDRVHRIEVYKKVETMESK